jgi:hypothetical protein
VTQVVVSFSEPVSLSAAALGNAANPSNDGMTWVVRIVSTPSFSYALGGPGGACLNDGVYHLTVNNNGTVNALDYAQFKKRFGMTFSY